jgi:Tfp pilus assembly protein PilE
MAMESDLLETVIYVLLVGVLPYVAVEAYEFAQRTIARRRQAHRH